jgi:aryl-alcohol dehydrogenase-like predicted oxidoreductase
VSKISFGTASLHKLLSKEKGFNILSAAVDIGISHFDTAPMYGYGYAENLLGEYLSKRRANFTITTKIGFIPNYNLGLSLPSIWARKVIDKIFKSQYGINQDWSIRGVQYSLDESLRRLKTDYIDILVLHEPDYSIINNYEMINWLHDKKKQVK